MRHDSDADLICLVWQIKRLTYLFYVGHMFAIYLVLSFVVMVVKTEFITDFEDMESMEAPSKMECTTRIQSTLHPGAQLDPNVLVDDKWSVVMKAFYGFVREFRGPMHSKVLQVVRTEHEWQKIQDELDIKREMEDYLQKYSLKNPYHTMDERLIEAEGRFRRALLRASDAIRNNEKYLATKKYQELDRLIHSIICWTNAIEPTKASILKNSYLARQMNKMMSPRKKTPSTKIICKPYILYHCVI